MLEIERKFLLTTSGADEAFLGEYSSNISYLVQGYLSEAKPSVRVRLNIHKKTAHLCVKGKRQTLSLGLSGKPEFEYEVPYDAGLQMVEMCKKNVLKKVRYNVPIVVGSKSLTMEVDVYIDPWFKGLATAELEKPGDWSLEEFSAVKLPPYLKWEITASKGWSNRALARSRKLPELPKKFKDVSFD